MRLLFPGTALAMVAFAWPVHAGAQEADVPQEQVTVQPGTIKDSSGRISVNLAAGTGNQQMAGATVALGAIAGSTGIARQIILTPDASDRITLIEVPDDAFAGNSGLLSINISAGTFNQSANLAQLAMGSIVAMSDQLLEQSRASTEPSGGTGSAANAPNDAIKLSDGAFRDNSGLVQLNLIGGERNSSANIFQLSMSAGSNP